MKAWFKHVLMLVKLQSGRLGRVASGIFRSLAFAVSLSALVMLAFSIGFDVQPVTHARLLAAFEVILCFFFWAHLLRLVFLFKALSGKQGFGAQIAVLIFLLVVVMARHDMSQPAPNLMLQWLQSDWMLYGIVLVVSATVVSKSLFGVMQHSLNPSLLFAWSFLFFILLGTALLMLPKCSVQAGSIRFLDALFTSTSAVCITGIGVLDVAGDLTFTGQLILLCLAQVGAIGVMTFTSFFAMSFMGVSSFQNQIMLKDLLDEDRLGAIFRTMQQILLVTLVSELIGTLCIYMSVRNTLPLDATQTIWYAFFHAVSAFCNSGISLFPDNLQNQLVQYNFALHSCLAVLVMLGGIGFPILFNYGRLCRHAAGNMLGRLLRIRSDYVHQRILTVNTRLAIVTTGVLMVAGTVLFFCFEHNNSLVGLRGAEKLAASFFGAVTPRSAGFSALDLHRLTSPALILTMLLMWVGASPMSCGGGIKTTTLSIALLTVVSVARGRRRIEIFGREIASHTLRRSFAVIMLSFIMIVLVTCILVCLEPRMSPGSVFFDAIAVLSTAGLTLHNPVEYSDAGRIVLMVSMFVGRVGAVTLLTGFLKQKAMVAYTYPTESVMVG